VEFSISQHAEEAEFLWTQRSAAVHAPNFRLRDLARLDDRIEAHIDGLRVAGDLGWDLCLAALEGPGEIFAASVLALESRSAERIQPILSAVNTLPLTRGVVSALGWLTAGKAEPYIIEWLESAKPMLRWMGVAGAAVRRFSAVNIDQLLSDADAAVRARACRSVGELGLQNLIGHLSNHLKDSDQVCRFWSAWSIALLDGDLEALDILASAVDSTEALDILARRTDSSAGRTWVEAIAADPRRRRSALFAAGALGDPHFVDWVIGQMSDHRTARIAAEAFTNITGADLLDEKLAAEKPPSFESQPTDDAEDENVGMDPDENLPWPDANLMAKWWSQHKVNFQKGTRYLLGQSISVDWCQQVLRKGRQRQRAAAALELAIRQPGQPLFNVAAPGFRQQQMLGIKK
jgi:uncharacterized protein (TIGR02270 family)